MLDAGDSFRFGSCPRVNQGEHKAKATPGSVFIKIMEEKTGIFLLFSGDWYRKNLSIVYCDYQLSGMTEPTQSLFLFGFHLPSPMPYPCSHLYSTKFSSGGDGQVPRKLSHSLNSSVHKPSLVQTIGTCKAEGEQLVLLTCLASAHLGGSTVQAHPSHQPQPEKSSPRHLGCSYLVQPMCTDQKGNCFPAAAESHQRESATLLLTRPSPSIDKIPGWKS